MAGYADDAIDGPTFIAVGVACIRLQRCGALDNFVRVSKYFIAS
jgi:hypothetical protein